MRRRRNVGWGPDRSLTFGKYIRTPEYAAEELAREEALRKRRETFEAIANETDHAAGARMALAAGTQYRDSDGKPAFMDHALVHALLALVEELREEG